MYISCSDLVLNTFRFGSEEIMISSLLSERLLSLTAYEIVE